MGLGSRKDGPQKANGFGKRGAVRLPPADRRASADASGGEPGQEPGKRISYYEDGTPADKEEQELRQRQSRATLRSGLIAGGVLLVGVPLIGSFIAGSGSQSGSTGSTSRIPVVVPLGGATSTASGQHGVSRGGFGSTGASAHIGG